MKNIITISREFGSGGRSIGKQVAEKLGYAFYDRELVDEVAKRSGFAPEYIEEHGEYANARNSLLFYLATAERYSHDNLSMHDQLYITQSKIIEELAEKGKCVIVGRCADYVLRDDPNVALVNLFVHAPLAARIRRESARTNTTPAEAEKRIRQVDKERAAYYNFFSSKRWGDAQAYDLCVNTDGLEISDVAKLVLRYLELRGLR